MRNKEPNTQYSQAYKIGWLVRNLGLFIKDLEDLRRDFDSPNSQKIPLQITLGLDLLSSSGHRAPSASLTNTLKDSVLGTLGAATELQQGYGLMSHLKGTSRRMLPSIPTLLWKRSPRSGKGREGSYSLVNYRN